MNPHASIYMKTPLHPSVLIKTLLPLILLGSFSAYAQKSESAPEESGFVKREVTIWLSLIHI